MSQDLCLKWNNHNIAFNKLLSKIYLEDMYSDGTILCHGKFYPVHRFVLSTCSDYFEEMFRQCIRLNNKHPFIIVKDIQPEQMEALLNYMYKGEVNVPQEMLPELIKAAEAFKIKGLAVPDEEPTLKSSRKRSNVSSPSSISKKSKIHEDKQSNYNKTSTNLDSNNHNNEDDSNEVSKPLKTEEIYKTDALVEIKSEPVDPHETSKDNSEVITTTTSLNQNNKISNFDSYCNDDTSSYEGLSFDSLNENFDDGQSTSWDNSQAFEGEENREANENDPSLIISYPELADKQNHQDISTFFRRTERGWGCPQCYYFSIQKPNVRAHYRRRHTTEKPFQCPFCTFRSVSKRDLVKKHVPSCARKHGKFV